MSTPAPLTPMDLCRRCDPDSLPFQTTAELADLPEVLGQDRALEAIRFATSMRHEGYNLFVLGAMGTGRHEVTLRFLSEVAAGAAVAEDLAYVHNFADADRPRALRMPPGRAVGLRAAMIRLVEDLRAAIPAAFDTNEYRTRRAALDGELKERQAQIFEVVRARALEQQVAMIQTPTGIALAPLKDGEVLPPEDFEKLSDEERAAVEERIAKLHDELEAAFRDMPRFEKEARERTRQLDREVTSFAVDHLLDELRAKYADLPGVTAYLDAVQTDVIDHADRFLPPAPGPMGLLHSPLEAGEEQDPHRRYQVNVLVDRGAEHGAPVIYEDKPSMQALVGRVDHRARMGALFTDHTLIRAGALHRANGGYLVLDARKLLSQSLAWETLKQTLQAREIRIESLGQVLSLVSTVSLEPEPVPVSVKVVLIGEPLLYHLLSAYDPDFNRLFKVPAEFEDRMVASDDSRLLYCRMLATTIRQNGLRHLDRGATARVLAAATRMAGDIDRLSTHLLDMGDLLRAADHEAERAGHALVTAADVIAARQAEERRRGSMRDRLLEATESGLIRVETAGAVVGQINGLAVIEVGGLMFGRPSRISARAWPGRGRVLDIEREVALGGPLHSKGVLILTGFLGDRYGRSRPLALSASLVFEQSYSGVDGDSATLAETVALLSAIASVPIRQDLAVTGSLDQLGNVQAVGGVNEKIEGFFRLCAARGLSGTQGVLLPASNVRNLQLADDVVDAVGRGSFHIWPVRSIDEALGLLTGMEAGHRDADGAWIPDTFNAAVDRRLGELAATVRRFAREDGEEAEK